MTSSILLSHDFRLIPSSADVFGEQVQVGGPWHTWFTGTGSYSDRMCREQEVTDPREDNPRADEGKITLMLNNNRR